jgi:DNA-binding MarR family transcriptional regulator
MRIFTGEPPEEYEYTLITFEVKRFGLSSNESGVAMLPNRQQAPAERRYLGEPVEFMRLVWAVDHALQKTSKRMARTLGVTGPQRLVIRIVGRFPGISPGELADILCVHPSTLTGVLQRLLAHRSIESRPDANDRRRALLSLTAKGRELDRRTGGTVEAGVRRALAGLSSREIEAAGRALRTLAAVLTEKP